MSKDKDKAGGFFSMDDGEQRDKEPRQSRRELEALRHQFMNRAKQFMDDTALGEGRKMVEKFIGKVQNFVHEDEQTAEAGDEEAWEGEMLDEDTPERPFAAEADGDEDAPWEEPAEAGEELDWSRPEYIRAGYAKPGTRLETAKSLEEAQEESFSLKMGNLSGLLSRFGSEDASPEPEARSVSRHRMEMDKPLFRSQMDSLYAELSRQIGSTTDARLWLHPEVLTMLRARNQPPRILLFAMAALFAAIDENYLTLADQAWIAELMERAGFLLDPKEIQRVVEQTFVFPERVHRLYENLLNEPIQIVADDFDRYRENLAKLYIYEVAARYDADPQNVIRTLASRWQEAASGLQQALAQVVPINEQYGRFVQKKMASATLFARLRQAEDRVLDCHAGLQSLAREVEALKRVTRLIEEEDALERLNQFRTDLVLSPEARVGGEPISLYDLREQFIRAQLDTLRSAAGDSAPPPSAPELSPVEQKHAIARAKEGELKSLRLIETFKAWRIAEAAAPAPEAEPRRPAGETAGQRAPGAETASAERPPVPQPPAAPAVSERPPVQTADPVEPDRSSSAPPPEAAPASKPATAPLEPARPSRPTGPLPEAGSRQAAASAAAQARLEALRSARQQRQTGKPASDEAAPENPAP